MPERTNGSATNSFSLSLVFSSSLFKNVEFLYGSIQHAQNSFSSFSPTLHSRQQQQQRPEDSVRC